MFNKYCGSAAFVTPAGDEAVAFDTETVPVFKLGLAAASL